MKPGCLYLIPATLADVKGNPQGAGTLLDWSLPPLVRSQAAALTCFAAENAKSARAFLKILGVGTRLQAIDILEIGHHPDANILKPLVDKLLGGLDVGVLVEAGCPGIADPGAQLARLAHRAGIRVAPLTGPSSILLALMGSGLDGQRFAFAGYAPVKSPQREAFIKKLESRSAREQETQILIETPYRNAALWNALLSTLSTPTRLARATGLTLVDESIRMQTIEAWRAASPLPPDSDKLPAVFLFLAG